MEMQPFPSQNQAMTDDLEALYRADTVEAVWELLTGYMARFGFERILYGFTRFMTPQGLGDTQDCMILSNFPKDYLDSYINRGLYFDAPMVKWATENVGSCPWTHIANRATSGDMSETERKVMEFNHKYDVVAGYTISFKDISPRAKGALGLAGNPGVSQEKVDQIWAEHGREILVLANSAHLKLTHLPYRARHRTLTARQRETLEWVSEGKTTQDIATIMGLTPATIEKHLRLARETLNVDTTAQAVLKASYQNQIFVLDQFC